MSQLCFLMHTAFGGLEWVWEVSPPTTSRMRMRTRPRHVLSLDFALINCRAEQNVVCVTKCVHLECNCWTRRKLPSLREVRKHLKRKRTVCGWGFSPPTRDSIITGTPSIALSAQAPAEVRRRIGAHILLLDSSSKPHLSAVGWCTNRRRSRWTRDWTWCIQTAAARLTLLQSSAQWWWWWLSTKKINWDNSLFARSIKSFHHLSSSFA